MAATSRNGQLRLDLSGNAKAGAQAQHDEEHEHERKREQPSTGSSSCERAAHFDEPEAGDADGTGDPEIRGEDQQMTAAAQQARNCKPKMPRTAGEALVAEATTLTSDRDASRSLARSAFERSSPQPLARERDRLAPRRAPPPANARPPLSGRCELSVAPAPAIHAWSAANQTGGNISAAGSPLRTALTSVPSTPGRKKNTSNIRTTVSSCSAGAEPRAGACAQDHGRQSAHRQAA